MLSSRKEFSGSQGRTLHFLLAQTEDVFQKDIEEEYSIRPSTATELLKQMEKNELITGEPMVYDNRLLVGINGIFIAQPVSDALALILSISLVAREHRRLVKTEARRTEEMSQKSYI